MHNPVLPKDTKMPAATLAYPQYTYLEMQWRGLIPGTLELHQDLHALERTATADCMLAMYELSSKIDVSRFL